MQNLRTHFNRKARRKRDMDFFILWMILLLLIEQNRRLQRQLGYLQRPPGPG